jgi:hypothetical protein
VIPRLFRREEARVHLLLDVRVILCDLRERSIPQQVHARIAHLADHVARRREQQHRSGGAHPLLVHFRDRPIVDVPVGLLEGLLHAIGRGLVVQVAHPGELALHGLHGHLARHLARRMSSHAVGDDEEAAVARGTDGIIVFVSGSDHSNVSPSGVKQTHH